MVRRRPVVGLVGGPTRVTKHAVPQAPRFAGRRRPSVSVRGPTRQPRGNSRPGWIHTGAPCGVRPPPPANTLAGDPGRTQKSRAHETVLSYAALRPAQGGNPTAFVARNCGRALRIAPLGSRYRAAARSPSAWRRTTTYGDPPRGYRASEPHNTEPSDLQGSPSRGLPAAEIPSRTPWRKKSSSQSWPCWSSSA